MNRIVFWLALIALGYLVWRFIQLAQRKNQRWRDQRRSNDTGNGAGSGAGSDSQAGRGAGDNGDPAKLARSEIMVRCAHCGVYLPSSDALTRGEQAFCSAEHRDAGGR